MKTTNKERKRYGNFINPIYNKIIMNYIICHYSEIGLKGKNRRFFEEKLVENIKRVLDSLWLKRVKRISGLLLVELTREGIENKEKIKEFLKNVFGIAYFAFALKCEQDIEIIEQKALEILKKEEFRSFKISAKRSQKDFPLTSQEINERVGEYIIEKIKNQKSKIKIAVDLKNPDIICFIEIVEKYAFLYAEKISGQGGLPVGVSGKGVSLLSGGIDSPVASFYAQKRGIELVFLHFTSYPFAKKSSLEKVKKIVKVLNRFQSRAKLYLVPFTDIQREILLKTKAKLRVVLYRRMMFRIAELIAKKEKAKVLITGENIGQVASQTIENLSTIEEAVNLLVLRPLAGFDKQEIVNKAREIGTFDISIMKGDDCCQRFLPKYPETKADLKEAKREEEKIDIKGLIEKALKITKTEEFKI